MSFTHQMAKVLLHLLAHKRCYTISTHAFQRMGERAITEEDIVQCAAQADITRILETQYHGRDPKIVVQGVDSEGKEFYMVVASADPPVVITVCRFIDEVWQELGQCRIRR